MGKFKDKFRNPVKGNPKKEKIKIIKKYIT